MTQARQTMVRTQLVARDIDDPAVLAAMGRVPRHRFMPERSWPVAYADGPAPIGHDQTISQPYIVAFMTQAIAPRPGARVLEVGTGSGYQAAVLSELGAEVWSIEIVEPLGRRARGALIETGYPVAPATDAGRGTIHLRIGDGYRGWPADDGGGAPYDAIVVTAAPDHVPPDLLAQLADGGRMVIPVGPTDALQHLMLYTRDGDAVHEHPVFPVAFVPMTGEARTRHTAGEADRQ